MTAVKAKLPTHSLNIFITVGIFQFPCRSWTEVLPADKKRVDVYNEEYILVLKLLILCFLRQNNTKHNKTKLSIV